MAGRLIFTSIAMVSVGLNRGTITGCGSDGKMRHKSWDGSKWLPSNTGWDNVGGPQGGLKWAPATVALPAVPAQPATPGNMSMIGIGGDGQMWCRNGTGSGSAWGSWENLGGSFATPATSASWNTSGSVPAVAVAGVGTDTALWMKTNTGSKWGSWENLGGTFWSAPTMTTYGSSRRAVMGVGIDRQLWAKDWGGSNWGQWVNLGGSFISNVVLISRAAGSLHVFGVGEDKQVWCLSSSKVVLMLTTSSQMWTRELNSVGWGSWQAMGGNFTSAPAAIASSSSRIDCFGKGSDGNVRATITLLAFCY